MFYNVKLCREKKLYNLNVSADGLISKEEVFDDANAN
jgi:hypothetical protein